MVPISRRDLLRAGAGAAAFTLVSRAALAGETRIDGLIGEAQPLPTISQRIALISRGLLGTPYVANTLIGTATTPEKFVIRDDAFDCVTYCETVLAAAIARAPEGFADALRTIRYHNGMVEWRERNHYFFEWGEHNIENKIVRAITMDGEVEIKKTVTWHKELGARHFDMHVIPRAVLLANKDRLATGDIIAFVNRLPNMDYFHTGFVVFGAKNEFLLRHASEVRGQVVDEDMARFTVQYGIDTVTLLRPLEPAKAV